MTLTLRDPQVIAVFVGIARGDLSAYDIMSAPKTPAQMVACADVERRYNRATEGSRFHPDDDFEELLDVVADEYADEYKSLL